MFATQGVFSFSRRNDIREGADTNRGSRVTLNSNHGHNITGNQMNAEGTHRHNVRIQGNGAHRHNVRIQNANATHGHPHDITVDSNIAETHSRCSAKWW